jgi:ATP-binding cassette subfamily F protein 3
VRPFGGDLDDYPAWLTERRSGAGGARPPGQGEHLAAARRDRRRQEAEQRKRLQPLRARIQRLESELQRLHRLQEELAAELAHPELYAAEAKADLLRLLERKRALDQAIAEAESAWVDTGEALEVEERAQTGPV